MVVKLNSTMMTRVEVNIISEDRRITVQLQGMPIMGNPKMMEMSQMMTTTRITMMRMKAVPMKTMNRMKKMKRRWIKKQKRNNFQLSASLIKFFFSINKSNSNIYHSDVSLAPDVSDCDIPRTEDRILSPDITNICSSFGLCPMSWAAINFSDSVDRLQRFGVDVRSVAWFSWDEFDEMVKRDFRN